MHVKVLNTPATEMVITGLHESAGVRGSFAIYAAPLLFMMIFALIGGGFNTQLEITQSAGLTILFGLAGLAGGVVWLRHYAASISCDTVLSTRYFTSRSQSASACRISAYRPAVDLE